MGGPRAKKLDRIRRERIEAVDSATPPESARIPLGSETLERDCAECGKRTVWYHAYIEGDLAAGGRGWWQWICAGPLTAEERAAG